MYSLFQCFERSEQGSALVLYINIITYIYIYIYIYIYYVMKITTSQCVSDI